MGNPLDLTGHAFGRWTVIRLIGSSGTTKKRRFWLCQCECGNEKVIQQDHLARRKSRSCGCLRKEISQFRAAEMQRLNTKTGLSRSHTYSTWVNMKGRCNNPNTLGYENYGGRGIKVCERWANSFEDFLADMGIKPKGMSLDRFPDNNGNYEPGNCRWATAKEQANNTRSNRLVTIDGETMTLKQASEKYGISYRRVLWRANAGFRLETILNPDKLPMARPMSPGFAAVVEKRRAKTHCPKGHPYEGDNLYIPPKGGRECRQCAKDRSKKFYSKQKSLQSPQLC